jgi:1,4-alpha-glucan branching enzyme
MPVRTPAGPVAFGRDPETSRLLWCARSGYPADPVYREFHSDIGHSLPLRNIKRFVHPRGLRMPTGIKYHSITGQTEGKRLYRHEAAMGRAGEHARDFVRRVRETADGISCRFGFSPLVTLAFDAELLGHWWFEGIEWLEHVLRLAGEMTVTPSGFLGECGGLDTVFPVLSSWGEGGYGGTWSDITNRWAIGPLLRATARMDALRGPGGVAGPKGRAACQAERELLLAQASDWPFLIQKGASAEYAEARLRGHLAAFDRLCAMLKEGNVDMAELSKIAAHSPIFREIGAI